MVDRDELKEHLRFLDEASDTELDVRERELVKLIGVLSVSDARRDSQFLLRLLREEKAARMNLQVLAMKRRQRQD